MILKILKKPKNQFFINFVSDFLKISREAKNHHRAIKKAVPNRNSLFCDLYPEPVSNRHVHYWTQDFKSGASTNSAIWATLV